MECESEVLRIQKKLDKMLKKDDSADEESVSKYHIPTTSKS